MLDKFAEYRDNPMAPAKHCFEITPHDTQTFALVTKAIYVGAAGDITLKPLDSSADVVFRNLPEGSFIDVRATAVRTTGTTAQHLVGLA
ncbi:hypothetical protein CP97_01420 [Aurantiacibacter atlanticus]|uniref:Uncharacterized protein n=1 Tax=Aurantiacibacter atlanticus TaxID=1648404 RepID=A0A0H4VDQ1_9SPHN|nr:hypothetical protein [Aurantiacibacter atlanticus]AKQ40996.1 hypothetical protein CP97_01420 [Aurantiacibacter atlanticus]